MMTAFQESTFRSKFKNLNREDLEDALQCARIKFWTSKATTPYGKWLSAVNAGYDEIRSQQRHSKRKHTELVTTLVEKEEFHYDPNEYLANLGRPDPGTDATYLACKETMSKLSPYHQSAIKKTADGHSTRDLGASSSSLFNARREFFQKWSAKGVL